MGLRGFLWVLAAGAPVAGNRWSFGDGGQDSIGHEVNSLLDLVGHFSSDCLIAEVDCLVRRKWSEKKDKDFITWLQLPAQNRCFDSTQPTLWPYC